MSFEEFLKYIREHIGQYCTDSYWKVQYNLLKDRSPEGVKKEEPFLAIHAIATDYSSKNKIF